MLLVINMLTIIIVNKIMCVFGTRNSKPDSVFKSKKLRVPHEKKMFGTSDLNEDWNPNLNFMWVPYQFWVQPFTCFWIQAGFKSGLNFYVGPNLLPLLGPSFSFLPFSLSLLQKLLCFSLSCSRPLQSKTTRSRFNPRPKPQIQDQSTKTTKT